MSPLLQPKYQLIFVLCLAVGVSLFCKEVDARKRDGSDEDSSGERGRWPDWKERDKKTKFVCPSSYGTFADVEDCEYFYVCNRGRANHRRCPSWRKFDKYRKSCLSIYIAVCDDGTDGKTTKPTTVSYKTTTPTTDDKFMCPSFSGSYPHPEDCSKYYTCTFFIPSLKTCPKDKLFDGVKKECKKADEVHCGSRKRPTTPAPSTVPTTPNPTTIKITTPELTTTLKPTTPEPTTPELTTTLKPTTIPEPTIPELTTTLKPTTTPEPTTPELTTTLKPTTPEPTTPEPTTPEPTTPEPTTPEPTTTLKPTGPPETDCAEDDLDCIIKETGEIPNWFECPDDIGSYRHPSSKKLFIFCINKKPFVKRCGQDLVFSEELRTCVGEGHI